MQSNTSDLHGALREIHLPSTTEHIKKLTRKDVCRLPKWQIPCTPEFPTHFNSLLILQVSGLPLMRPKIAGTSQSKHLRIRVLVKQLSLDLKLTSH